MYSCMNDINDIQCHHMNDITKNQTRLSTSIIYNTHSTCHICGIYVDIQWPAGNPLLAAVCQDHARVPFLRQQMTPEFRATPTSAYLNQGDLTPPNFVLGKSGQNVEPNSMILCLRQKNVKQPFSEDLWLGICWKKTGTCGSQLKKESKDVKITCFFENQQDANNFRKKSD